VAGISLDQPTATSSEIVASIPTKKARLARVSVPETVIAAEQVALGLAASEIVEVALDANANIVETVDTHGARTTAEYNDAGDPVKIVSADGTITYYAYDADGNLTSIYNEKPVRVAAFSWKNPLASVIAYFSSFARALAGEGAAQNTAIAYDAGNLTEVTDSQGAVAYEYDESGNLSAETNTEGEYTVYDYDEFGNITGKEVVTPVTSQAVSSVTKFLAFVHLEGLSRFIARAYADEEKVAQEESFGYDDRNNLEAFAVGITGIAPAFTAPEPAPVAVPSTPVIQEAVPLAPQASSTVEVPVVEPIPVPVVEVVPAPVTPEASVEVPVNAIQEVVSFLSAPFRTVFAWVAPFMARAVAQEVVEVLPEATPATTGESIVVWNTRDALDNLTETENQWGEVTKYRYDSKADALVGKTVTSAQGSVLSDISYGFDSTNSRWTSRTENGKSESYEYDTRGQLISGTGSYAYDEHGNRISSSDSRGEGSYTYEGNRLLSLVRGDATKSYEYDDNGNVVAIRDSKKGATTLSYTGRGAIAGIALPDGTQIRYTYDALNRRVEKSVGNRIERYQYEGKNLTRVLNESGTVLRQYVYDPKGALIAIIRDQAVYSVILDAKGSVVALTDSRSEVVARFSYDAWGTPESTDTGLTDFYFASGYYEAEAGLYILGPRTYDPSLGRFLQKDPLAGSLLDLVSQNEYVYANNDPVNKIDPTGHRAEVASVGQSAKAIAASARAAARQMSAVITEKKKEIADLEADPLSSQDDVLAARGALAAALEAKEAMLELAKNNEEDVARREAREIEEAFLDAAWQASLQSVVAPVLEATTTPEVVPSVEIVPIEVPVESPQLPIVEDPGPISFLRDVSGFVSESLYKLVPKAEAKKKKAKKPKPPPPPKKVVKKEAPKKLSKAELRRLEKEEKEAKALRDLESARKNREAQKALAAAQKKEERARRELEKARKIEEKKANDALAVQKKEALELENARKAEAALAAQKKAPAQIPLAANVLQAVEKGVANTTTGPSTPTSKQSPVQQSTAPLESSKISGLNVGFNASSVGKWVQEGASALYDQSPAWRYAMDNPLVAGAAVGVGAGVAAYAGAAGITAASVQYLGGAGTTCLILCPKAGVEANRLIHTFGNPTHALEPLIAKFGSQQAAFNAVQNAANQALKAGKLVPDAQGILPKGDLGVVINVQGIAVRLIGGWVQNGQVIISSFSRWNL
jgi:RHS repeat-associated protein